MSTEGKPRSRGAKLLRRGLGALAILGGVLAAVYEYQPQRYDVVPRTLPQNNAWTDPDSANLFHAGTKILVVTAHPDDAEFYIGGLLSHLGASGAQITLVVCTDGDKGYYPFEDWQRNRRVRQQEQRDAAKIWNALDVEFLSYPDGRLFANPDVIARLAAIMQRVQPEYILAFDYRVSAPPESPRSPQCRRSGRTGRASSRKRKVASPLFHHCPQLRRRCYQSMGYQARSAFHSQKPILRRKVSAY